MSEYGQEDGRDGARRDETSGIFSFHIRDCCGFPGVSKTVLDCRMTLNDQILSLLSVDPMMTTNLIIAENVKRSMSRSRSDCRCPSLILLSAPSDHPSTPASISPSRWYLLLDSLWSPERTRAFLEDRVGRPFEPRSTAAAEEGRRSIASGLGPLADEVDGRLSAGGRRSSMAVYLCRSVVQCP